MAQKLLESCTCPAERSEASMSEFGAVPHESECPVKDWVMLEWYECCRKKLETIEDVPDFYCFTCQSRFRITAHGYHLGVGHDTTLREI